MLVGISLSMYLSNFIVLLHFIIIVIELVILKTILSRIFETFSDVLYV